MLTALHHTLCGGAVFRVLLLMIVGRIDVRGGTTLVQGAIGVVGCSAVSLAPDIRDALS